MIRGGHPKAHRPRCARCDDAGLVILDAHIPDADMPDGFRKAAYTYRCDCPAGAPYGKFPLAPTPGGTMEAR